MGKKPEQQPNRLLAESWANAFQIQKEDTNKEFNSSAFFPHTETERSSESSSDDSETAKMA